MSLQRIFESARKLGIPVIVTDPSGRDPMVVLPLEHFEAMTGATGEEPVREKPVNQKEQTISENSEQVWEPIPDKSQDNLGNIPEMAPEERFYLEPVEDEAIQ